MGKNIEKKDDSITIEIEGFQVTIWKTIKTWKKKLEETWNYTIIHGRGSLTGYGFPTKGQAIEDATGATKHLWKND